MRRLALSFAFLLVASHAAAQEEPPPPPPPPAEPEPPPPLAKPSILIDAKDDAGREVRSVTVSVDDKVVAYEITGKPIEVEPGQHTITLQRNDGPRQRASASVTMNEGVTNHIVHFAFERAADPEPVLDKPDNAPLPPRIVAGVGILAVATGVVLLLARPSMPNNCDSDTGKCTKLPAESEATFDDERNTAGRNRGLLTAGTATLVTGAGITAVGVIWYALDRPKPRTAMIAPWLQPNVGGVVLRTSF